MRRIAALLLLALLAPACGGAAAGGIRSAGPASDPVGLPDVARIVCERGGTRLVTPAVRPQPDGVHVEIDGLRDGRSFVHPGGGDGSKEQVLGLPPGPARVGCVDRGGAPVGRGLVTLRVVDADRIWVDDRVSPRCEKTSTAILDYVADIDGMELTPGNLRRALGAVADDVVEPAGYPGAEERVFRVVRDGRVVAVGEFWPSGSGWLLDHVTSCA